MNHVFDNFEWEQFTHGVRIQNLTIGINSKLRVKPETCERWYNQDNGSTSICKPCKNPVAYRSSNGGYFCKSCAKEVNKINQQVTFTKI
jgi:hypothetical protein